MSATSLRGSMTRDQFGEPMVAHPATRDPEEAEQQRLRVEDASRRFARPRVTPSTGRAT